MSFDVTDFRDFLQVLDNHPEWQRDLRRVVLTEDLLALPESMRRLERLHAERMAELDQRLMDLTAAQDRNTAHLVELDRHLAELDRHMAELDRHMAELDRHMAELDQHMAELDHHMAQLDLTVAKLADGQAHTDSRVNKLIGQVLEDRFVRRAGSYLGQYGYRRVRVLSPDDWLDAVDDAVEQGRMSRADREGLLRADAIVRAQSAGTAVHLVVEVSSLVDRHDVERAQDRARALAIALGLDAVQPCVAGHAFTETVEALAAQPPETVMVLLPE